MAQPCSLYPDGSVLLAPLSGYTDLPFRRSCRRYGCFYASTPLVDARSLVFRNPRTASLLCRGEDEPWLGVQLVGECPELLAEATRRLDGVRHEVLDLNLGCPVRKVTRRGAGAALGANPDLAARCLEALVRQSHVPVTGKIRVLSAENPAPTIRLAKALENAGAQALTIHGREWCRFYSGPVAVAVIAAVRAELGIPVIANGGVLDRASADALRLATGCSRIMVARGAIGNPWLFRELLAGTEVAAPPSHELVCDETQRHVREMIAQYGEAIGMRNARKIILAYLAGRGYRRFRRAAVTDLTTLAAFEALLEALRQEGPSRRYRQPHARTAG